MQKSVSSSAPSTSSATWEDVDDEDEDEEMEEKLIEENDDFYERLFDEQFEPGPVRVTAL